MNTYSEERTIPIIGSYAIDTTLLSNEYAQLFYPAIYKFAKHILPEKFVEKGCDASCMACDACKKGRLMEIKDRTKHAKLVDTLDREPINLYGENKTINPIEPTMQMQDMAPKKSKKAKSVAKSVKKGKKVISNDELEMAGLLSKYNKII